MQPIVLRIANSDGFSDYSDGLPPTDGDDLPNLSFVEFREAPLNYGVLGNPTEPLLAQAISHINSNTPQKQNPKNLLPNVKVPIDDRSFRMVLEPIPGLSLKDFKIKSDN